MLKTYEKLRIPDKKRKNDFYAEVNWREDDKLTNDCQVIKFIFPNGSEALVDREDFLHFCFVIGTPEQQRKMIPQRIQTVRSYETVVGIVATKDIRKGEKINFPIKLDIPSFDDIVGELQLENLAKSKNIILPKKV